ncbi:hypothetical protein [Acetobacter malorum]|uniref:hypothetical protein n=1 Tax=Acetobacter malorum TaxID=178901 RepID=UPI000A362C6F|nr:hypothetical protein [Acetobacter malorum]
MEPPAAFPTLPSKDACWHWIEQLNSFGPRLTGTPAHEASLAFLATELEKIGLKAEETVHSITRWTPEHVSLSGPDGPIPVAAPYPYSGQTPAEGVSAELVWYDGKPHSFRKAQGKIAVILLKRIDLTRFLISLFMKRKNSLPDQSASFPARIKTPLLTGLMGVALDKARKAGVRGVICLFEGVSPPQLAGQVVPFTTPYADLPALWVSASERTRLKALATTGQKVTLTLKATVEPVQTRSLHAVLPGQRQDETLLITTHTDGPNACEENGAAGVLALAHYFSGLPLQARQRTLIFVLATGHFQIPQIGLKGDQATSAWLAANQPLWDGKAGHARAVAGITLEHLGCMEWRDNPTTGTPEATGELERDIVYTTNRQFNQIYCQAARLQTRLRAVTVFPRLKKTMLGEGQPLYSAGIPVISTCPIPDYLCQILPGGGLERLNAEYASQQIMTFARVATALVTLPKKHFGHVPFSRFRALLRSVLSR